MKHTSTLARYVHLIPAVNIGLTISRDRMAACFPFAEIWMLEASQDINQRKALPTAGWHPLAWGRELMRRDVSILFCAGIDQFLWGSLQAYGIQVIPNATGTPDEVLKQWQSGQLTVPPTWPFSPCIAGPRRRRGRGCGRRFQGGR